MRTLSLISRIKLACESLKGVWGNPDDLTYYPECRRKSRFHIFYENLHWMLKYREINHFYYFYGCDRTDGPDPFSYVCKKEFIRRRDAINARARIGLMTINYNCMLQDKFFFSQYLTALGFSTPRVVGLADKSIVRWLHPRQDLSWDDFVRRHTGTLFVKDILGERAQGVFMVTIDKGIIQMSGRTITVSELRQKIGPKNILQERICQHPELDKINPASVNTVRIVTVRAGNDIRPISAMLRVGAGTSACDNLASGGIAIGITAETGELFSWGVYKPGFGKRTDRHPATGFVFKGTVLPFFKDIVSQVCLLHQYFYGIHSVGWDVAITADGPTFLEGNNSWEIPTLQVFDNQLIKRFNESLKITASNP